MRTIFIRNGFTLIETLVAVSILSLATAGPLYTASRVLVAAQISRDQLTASYLAQEGIEAVRAIRDDAYLANMNTGWNDFSTAISSCTSSKCQYDPVPAMPASLAVCAPVSGCVPLGLSGGMYRIGGTATVPVFTREITITDISPTEKKVTSKVLWNSHGSHSVIVTTHLTPWQ